MFDLDTGPHYNNQPTMQETLLACGMESYFTHGPTTSAKRSNVRKHMCANIDTREYMDIVYVEGCVRATGLKEGRGSDNPQEFYEVMMNTVEPHYNGLSGTCADYDQCPAAPFGSMLCDSDRDGDPGTDAVSYTHLTLPTTPYV